MWVNLWGWEAFVCKNSQPWLSTAEPKLPESHGSMGTVLSQGKCKGGGPGAMEGMRHVVSGQEEPSGKGGVSLHCPRGLGLSHEKSPGRRVGYTQGNSSTVRIQLWPRLPKRLWNFLSWMPVKTRWIISNSLDKSLLRGGCAANFYQTFESISECTGKGSSSYWHLCGPGSGGPALEQGQPQEDRGAPRQAGARGGIGRDRPPMPSSW